MSISRTLWWNMNRLLIDYWQEWRPDSPIKPRHASGDRFRKPEKRLSGFLFESPNGTTDPAGAGCRMVV